MEALNFIIPMYPRQIQLSKSRIKKYFVWDGKRFRKGRSNSKVILPLKYLSMDIQQKSLDKFSLNSLNKRYKIAAIHGTKVAIFSNIEQCNPVTHYMDLFRYRGWTLKQATAAKWVLYDCVEEKPVLANPRAAGTPKMYTIRGQDFYAGTIHHSQRVLIVNALKTYFLKYVKNLPQVNDRESYHFQMTIHDNKTDAITTHTRWDVGNRGYIYMKTMLDLITAGYEEYKGILKDDGVDYITSESIIFNNLEGKLLKDCVDFDAHNFDKIRWDDINSTRWLQFKLIKNS